MGWWEEGREDSCIVVRSAHLRNTFRECLSISSTLVRSTPGLCVEQCQARKVEDMECSPFRPTPFLLMEVTASWMVVLSDIRPLCVCMCVCVKGVTVTIYGTMLCRHKNEIGVFVVVWC